VSAGRVSTGRRLAWIGAVAVAAAALLYGVVDDRPPRTDTERVYDLAGDFACPVCQGQSVAESDVPVARAIRREIGVWLSEGRTDDFIRAQLVDFYGEDIDYNPAASGVTSLVWIVPVVALAAALTGLVIVFRGWRNEADLEASPDDIRLVDAERGRDRP
jgi:cytochrome c-type biogenesis protein CcmH